MNINRHNYEEYFILYMDNELGSDDRRQVEAFVQKHPDLKEELELLLQYKLVPDTSIVFDAKEELMIHNGASTMTLDNYEEWLVLYMDDELTAVQRKTVEEFIAVHPAVKKDLAAFQQIKLQPEKIIFTNKEILYRRTAGRPVIAMRWWSVAAAVLIFAIGLTAVILVNKKSSTGNGLVIIPKTEQKIKKENQVVTINDEKKKDQQPAINNIEEQTVAQKQTKSNVLVKHNNVINKKLPVILPEMQKEKPLIVDNNQKPSNNLPVPINNATKINAQSESIVNAGIPKEPIKTDPPVTTPSSQPLQVVYNDDLNQPEGKKGKLRGFLRKVTRTFEKTTNINPADDENRVLVGGLAFKLN
jgi:hypothetical protein